MKIALDIDDVTVDMVSGLTTYNNEKYGSNLVFSDHTDFGLFKIWGCSPEESMRRVHEFYHSDLMDDLLPVDGAISGIKELYTKHQLYFVTSRPSFLRERTATWFQKYFPEIKIPVYFTNQFTLGEKSVKKSVICTQLGVEILVEDYDVNALDCAGVGIKVLLFDRPWNRKFAGYMNVVRVNSWKDVLQKLSQNH